MKEPVIVTQHGKFPTTGQGFHEEPKKHFPQTREKVRNLLREGTEDLRAGRLDQAISKLGEAARLDHGNADIFNNLGVAWLRLKKPELAARVFRQGLAINPNAGHMWNNLAECMLVSHQVDQGLNLLCRPEARLSYRMAEKVIRQAARSRPFRQDPKIAKSIDLLQRLLKEMDSGLDEEATIQDSLANNLFYPAHSWREKLLFGMAVAEREPWLRVEGMELLRNALNQSKGVVLLNSHICGGRMVPTYLAHEGIPVTSLEYANRLEGTYEEAGVEMLPLSGKADFFLKEVYSAKKALEAGRVLHLAGDGYKGNSQEVEVTFLGRRRRFKPGGAELSLLTDAPIMPVFTHLDREGRITISFLPPLERGQPEQSREVRIRIIVEGYAQLLSNRWRTYPADVIWKHIARYLSLPSAT